MADYPNVVLNNDFILSRYDGTLVDAAPWGCGARDGRAWPARATGIVDGALRLLEGRHPLALGHFANHPPPGAAPNVAIAPFDLTLDGAKGWAEGLGVEGQGLAQGQRVVSSAPYSHPPT